MAFVFKPAIWKNSTLYELPRPVLGLRIQDAWDFDELKVPLADGDVIAGRSQQGVDISVEGQVGTQGGTLKASESSMFQELESLRSALSADDPEDTYDFFIYHDASTATYRHFKSCTTSRFEYDLSNKHLFSYSILIHAEDPVIYTTGEE
jgi:hypothetical protein